MTRDEYLEEADKVLKPVGELLAKARMNVDTPFNPFVVVTGLEYAKVCSLAAIAAGGVPVAAEVLDLATTNPIPEQPPPSANGGGSGLVLPG